MWTKGDGSGDLVVKRAENCVPVPVKKEPPLEEIQIPSGAVKFEVFVWRESEPNKRECCTVHQNGTFAGKDTEESER